MYLARYIEAKPLRQFFDGKRVCTRWFAFAWGVAPKTLSKWRKVGCTSKFARSNSDAWSARVAGTRTR
jgi:hypothetical protein